MTKRVRRVFEFSKMQFEQAVRRNDVNVLFLTFCDYLRPEEKKEFVDYLTSSKFDFEEVYFISGFWDWQKNVEKVNFTLVRGRTSVTNFEASQETATLQFALLWPMCTSGLNLIIRTRSRSGRVRCCMNAIASAKRKSETQTQAAGFLLAVGAEVPYGGVRTPQTQNLRFAQVYTRVAHGEVWRPQNI